MGRAGSPAGSSAFRTFLHGLGGEIDSARERGLPVELVMRHEPDEDAQALMRTLGVPWRISDQAPRCALRCGHEECRVSAVAQNPLGLTWCPVCKLETVPLRGGTCGWCNGPTQPLKAPETLKQRGEIARETLRASARAEEERAGAAAARQAAAPRKDRPLGAAQTAILDLLTEHGQLRLKRIAELRGCRIETAYAAVNSLSKRGLVRKVQRGLYAATETTIDERGAAHDDERGADARVQAAAPGASEGARQGAAPEEAASGGTGEEAGPQRRVERDQEGEADAGAVPGVPGPGEPGTPRGLHEAAPGDVAMQDASRAPSPRVGGAGVGGRALSGESGSAKSQLDAPGEDAALTASDARPSPRALSDSQTATADEAPPEAVPAAFRNLSGIRLSPRVRGALAELLHAIADELVEEAPR